MQRRVVVGEGRRCVCAGFKEPVHLLKVVGLNCGVQRCAVRNMTWCQQSAAALCLFKQMLHSLAEHNKMRAVNSSTPH